MDIFNTGSSFTREYFDINPSAGWLYVKKSLTTTANNNFVVTNHALYYYRSSLDRLNRNDYILIYQFIEDFIIILHEVQHVWKWKLVQFIVLQAVVNVNDNGTPQRSASQYAYVTINVLRNQYTPFFINEPYRVDLGGNIGISTSIIDVTARDQDSPVSDGIMILSNISVLFLSKYISCLKSLL